MVMQSGKCDSSVSHWPEVFYRLFCADSDVCFYRYEHGQPAGGAGQRICSCDMLLSDCNMGAYSYCGGASKEVKRLYCLWNVFGVGVVGNSKQSVCGNALVHPWRHCASFPEGIQDSGTADCGFLSQRSVYSGTLWDIMAGDWLQSAYQDAGERI